MACNEYKALLPKYAEGELSAEQVRLLRDHLPHCESCRQTVRLLKLDDEAIRKLLFGHQQRSQERRRRLYRSALFFGVVLLVALVGLYLAYSSLDPERVHPGDPLGRRVDVSVKEMPAREFLRLLSREAGVAIDLSASAEARLAQAGPVTMEWKAARLEAVLEKLTEGHGIRLRRAGRSVLLETTLSDP